MTKRKSIASFYFAEMRAAIFSQVDYQNIWWWA